MESISQLLAMIQQETNKGNRDNISRTVYYEKYFFLHPEIRWAFLASFVSRNAGWNICDLEGIWLPKILPTLYRKQLFHLYEKANWLIFHDAYPQLMIYHYSTKFNRPLFHLLSYFSVSHFMKNEWEYFWHYKDRNRLMTALIINEQNLIQESVVTHPFYQKKIFRSFIFRLQEWFHFRVVLFPTRNGQIFGASVTNFQNVDKRIELGKKLASILFMPELHHHFIIFAKNTVPTGSRYDYEQYFPIAKKRETPFLRMKFPIVHHAYETKKPWDRKKKIKRSWFLPVKIDEPIELTKWYQKKEKELQIIIFMEEWWQLKKELS